MRKSHFIQIGLLLSGFLFVVYLFYQPKFIVDETQEGALSMKNEQKSAESSPSNHSSQEIDKERIEELTTLLINSENLEKKAIFADSIAQRYRKTMFFDSSAKYFELAATLNPVATNIQKAASGIFEAFQNSMTAEAKKELGTKAIGFLNKILEEDPSNVNAQIQKAVALVYTEPMPMGGITLLKKIINENPKNTEARLYLGEFQFTVGKIDAALEQFNTVHALAPMDFKALLYLTDGYISLGKKEKAEKYIKEIKALKSTDPYIKSVLEQFESEVNKL